MAVGYLATMGDALLQAAADALVAATTGHPAPSSVYLSHDKPSLLDHCCDDGVLTVHLEFSEHDTPFIAGQLSLGSPAGGRPCAVQFQPNWVITLGRCSPTFDPDGEVPTVATLDAAAEDLLVDLWAIITELYDRSFDCTLFPGMTQCQDFRILSTNPLPPEGGCAGWEIRVQTGTNDTGPIGS